MVVATVKATATDVGPPVTPEMATALAGRLIMEATALMKALLEAADEACQAVRETPLMGCVDCRVMARHVDRTTGRGVEAARAGMPLLWRRVPKPPVLIAA